MSAADLAEQILQQVRREFFAGMPEKRFFQERNLLLQAVTYPAAYLHRMGAELPAEGYEPIVRTVIETIKAHGNRAKIRRFSAYFLDCVQKHMLHHGEGYYTAAKRFRPMGKDAVSDAIGKVRAGEPAPDVIGTMVEIRRALRSKGGRRKNTRVFSEPDLFQSVEPQRAAS